MFRFKTRFKTIISRDSTDRWYAMVLIFVMRFRTFMNLVDRVSAWAILVVLTNEKTYAVFRLATLTNNQHWLTNSIVRSVLTRIFFGMSSGRIVF